MSRLHPMNGWARHVAKTMQRSVAASLPWLISFSLVFQILLTSAVVAQQAGAVRADPVPICINDPAGARADSNGGTGGNAGVHCPQCLSRVDVAILPPPPATPMLVRITIASQAHVPPTPTVPQALTRRDHRPRAPPLSI